MAGYGQFCPVAKAMELLDERWTMLVIRELLCGSRHFNALRRGVPRVSPSLLSARLRTLTRAGIAQLEHRGGQSVAVLPHRAVRAVRPTQTVAGASRLQVEIMGQLVRHDTRARAHREEHRPRRRIVHGERRIAHRAFAEVHAEATHGECGKHALQIR